MYNVEQKVKQLEQKLDLIENKLDKNQRLLEKVLDASSRNDAHISFVTKLYMIFKEPLVRLFQNFMSPEERNELLEEMDREHIQESFDTFYFNKNKKLKNTADMV